MRKMSLIALVPTLALAAQKAPPHREPSPDYMSCIWTVVEHESPYNVETWTSGDFDLAFPTQPGQAWAKHLANDFWARFSYFVDSGGSPAMMAEIVRTSNDTIVYNTTYLEDYLGRKYFRPVQMIARYDRPYAGKTKSDYLQTSLSCWFVQPHNPALPYPGMGNAP